MDEIIAALGIGSGFNSGQVIDDLIAADRAARATPLTTRVEALEARISALGQLSGALSGIATSLDTRVRSGALGLVPASSDALAVGIERLGTGPLTGFASTLVVNALASGQRLAAAPLASAAEPVGLGTLSFGFGARTELVDGDFSFSAGAVPGFDVTITAENNSLTGLRDAINRAGGPVTAAIITGNNGATLSLRGRDGAERAFVISAAAAPGDTGLSRFSYTPGNPALAISARAADADMVFDGVRVTRDSNTVDDLVVGTRLTLRRTTPAEGVGLAAARSGAALAETVSDFAETLGAMRGLIADFRRAPVAGGAAGALSGDTTARSMDQRIVSVINTPINAAGGMRLRDLGVAVTREGGVTFDAGRLAALTPEQQAQAEMLLRTLSGPASDAAPLRLQSIAALATPATEGLTRRRDAVNAELARVDVRLESYRDLLTRQFSAMNQLVAASRAVGEQLETQIAIWTNQRN